VLTGDEWDYDGVWYALNRFCIQAAIAHPLTVYGKGGQTGISGYSGHSAVCVAIANPAEPGQFRVFNQFTEHFSVGDLAMMVKKAGNAMGLNVEINHLKPRVEQEQHYYNAKNTNLLSLAAPLSLRFPTRFLAQLCDQVPAPRDKAQILPKVSWRRT